MAADLFESYAVMLVAALILGTAAFGAEGLVFPLIVPAIGALTAILGVYITRPRAGENGLVTINRSFYISAAVSAVLCTAAAFIYLPGSFEELTDVSGTGSLLAQILGDNSQATGDPRWIAAGAVIIGIVLAALILALTGYFTGTEHRPVKDVGKTALTGPATVVLSGLSVGFESAVYTALVIGAAVYGAFLLGGGITVVSLFAVALAGCGLLTTVGVIVAMDTFGPVSDNAQGIAEMSGDVDEEGAAILTELDAVGNTTKAITKGIAIATAVLAATALFGSFTNAVSGAAQDSNAQPGNAEELIGLTGVLNVANPANLVGLLIGAAVVFLFSGLAINAVGRAAGAVVFEVRRQFKQIPGIMEGTGRPEYGKVVDICTRDSLRELATPGLLALLAPIAVGFGLGAAPLGAYLAGAIGAGTLMAVFLANSGGAWDNAKKLVEDGHHGGKGSPAHEATVIGDTVGDPFKDTAGPAINPLIKVMNLVALLIAPAVVSMSFGENQNDALRITIAVVAALIVAGAVYISKRRTVAIAESAPEAEPSDSVRV
jgi:K(+)-stimulated pyrophosphate-energized sodium pump